MGFKTVFTHKTFLIFMGMLPYWAMAQFAGIVGSPNTSAIFKDSTVFVSWASGCELNRGFLNIADKGLGKASVGEVAQAIGKAGANGIVSLGDSGIATLSFKNAIINGVGADFAVFENSFSDRFLELAFVEVSNDGQKFVRFSATSNTQRDSQVGAFDDVMDATKINNLAGKYRANYGTPFDLEELKDSLDVGNIRFIRIIDVVGSINPNFGQKDAQNQLINDPYPTPFPSAGFDLDAVGVIHQKEMPIGIEKLQNEVFRIFPNPSNGCFKIEAKGLICADILDERGKLILRSTDAYIDISKYPKSLYLVYLKTKDGNQSVLKLLKE